jgi:hypothetical protein
MLYKQQVALAVYKSAVIQVFFCIPIKFIYFEMFVIFMSYLIAF